MERRQQLAQRLVAGAVARARVRRALGRARTTPRRRRRGRRRRLHCLHLRIDDALAPPGRAVVGGWGARLGGLERGVLRHERLLRCCGAVARSTPGTVPAAKAATGRGRCDLLENVWYYGVA